MTTEIRVAAWEGGALRVLAGDAAGREIVLALPLSRLIVKMVKVPPETDPVEFSTPILKALSPYTDEELKVSCETVSESAAGKVVIAAGVPEESTDDIANLLDAEKLSVTRIDALVLGELRGIWDQLAVEDGARRLVLFKSVDCLSILILDGEGPVAIRAITDESELKRELMLSLLEAEDFGGAKSLKEIVWVRPASLEAPMPELEFAPVREIVVGDGEAALRGIAERTLSPDALDVLPASWREVLNEGRFRHKLIRNLAWAGGLWLLIMTVLLGVPVVYGFMIDHQKQLSREHQRKYQEVKAMKSKVDLVRKYSDHDRGALEIMKAVSDRLPEGITLTSWDFDREDGLRIQGEAESANEVYEFKNTMVALAAGDEGEGELVFKTVNLIGPSAGKGNMQKFSLELGFVETEAAE